MFFARRSLTVALATSFAVGGLSLTTSAQAESTSFDVGRPTFEVPEPVARGLIVQTTTKRPTAALLSAAERALGSAADVVDDNKIGSMLSSIEFDEIVPNDVAAEAAAELEQRNDVVWAVPNSRVTLSAAPPVPKDDELFPNQRSVWDRKRSNGGYSIKAPAMWKATEGSPDIRVAVLDTGVVDHPELEDQLVTGYDFILDPDTDRDGQPGRDDDPSDPGDWIKKGECYPKSPARPSTWHGTFIAGQIAAKTDTDPTMDNGNPGIVGIAPGSKVMPVRVLGHCGGWDADIVAAITWASGGQVSGVPTLAYEDRARVINLSLGATYTTKSARKKACKLYGAAARGAEDRDVVLVAAAGNYGAPASLTVPASCEGFISVGATSLKGYSSLYSNYDFSVDIVAAGGDTAIEGKYDSVLSLGNKGTTTPGTNTYVRNEGTSMATAAVSGGAALALSAAPDASKSDVERILRKAHQGFPKRSDKYGRKKVVIGNKTYYVNLNCYGSHGCGSGILDLSRIPASTSPAVISGDFVVGEPMKVTDGGRVKQVSDKDYQWFANGVSVGRSQIYYPTNSDEGKILTAKVTPGVREYSHFTSLGEASQPVSAGPEIVVQRPPSPSPYGTDTTWTVDVVGSGDEVIEEGTVELRKTDGTVVATGATQTVEVAEGQPARSRVTFELSGLAIKPSKPRIRAAYLGSGVTPAASSPSRTFEIKQSVSTATMKLPERISHNARAKLKIKVKAPFFANPTGYVTVYDGHHSVLKLKMRKSDAGVLKVRLPKLSKRTHKIWLTYSGNDWITRALIKRRAIVSY